MFPPIKFNLEEFDVELLRFIFAKNFKAPMEVIYDTLPLSPFLPILFNELGLVIKHIALAGSARHIELHDPFCFSTMM